ncbi:MAG: deoxyhypusine synthase [Deltaproteobacteria bacterium CG2_30_66_27]|nr:MAG: deoxyhypusine synthase [Deltaproteobacteria bacterium CG2_30_66_27]PJB32982.1 MAG: deoxyhypusine synthase [Deltaproteobacteria bacterium CG_4_9_14_3_um_filter_65_9]
MARRSRYLSGARILPPPVGKRMSASELIEKTFLAYNAGRLREGARLLSERMLAPDVTVGLSLTGALTPAGLGVSCIVPLLKAGFVDWVVSTGANLYHDAHFGLGLPMHAGSPFLDDRVLRDEGVVRIYDVLFDYEVLLDTDAFFRRVLDLPEFQAEMGTAEFHYRLGRYMAEREKTLGQGEVSVLAAAWRYGVPVYTSSPGDSSIGMNVAAMRLGGRGVTFDVSLDVNETAAIVYDAKRRGGKSAVWILGGGSPKNFMLQTEPQIQEVLGLDEKGHDYFLQVTDARPDTGGLSGATPSEAVSWGKVDPDKLPDTVVCYLDSTVALPLLCAFAFDRVGKRIRRRLYDRREEMLENLGKAYRKAVNAAGVTKKRKVARKR